jgi:hypothetical protein
LGSVHTQRGNMICRCIAVASLLLFALSLSACSSGPPESSSRPPATDGVNGINGCDGGMSHAACAEAELQTFSECIARSCEHTFERCYGADQKSGDLRGGVCGSWVTCSNACACSDAPCREKCGPPGQECSACTKDIVSCTAKCAVPTCLSSSESNGTKACGDLRACCDRMVDVDKKDVCLQVHQSAGGNGLTCSAIYPTFAKECP